MIQSLLCKGSDYVLYESSWILSFPGLGAIILTALDMQFYYYWGDFTCTDHKVAAFVRWLTFHNKACHYMSQNKLIHQNTKNIFFKTTGFFFNDPVLKSIIHSSTAQ
jgi:hypothetical protein